MIIAAAKVGGILANQTYPAEFIFQNLMIKEFTLQKILEEHFQLVINLKMLTLTKK